MKKTKVITKLIAIILSILVVVQVAPMSTFAETIGTEGEKFEEREGILLKYLRKRKTQ